MTTGRELPFPGPDDAPDTTPDAAVEAALTARFARSYASMPAASAAQLAACVDAVRRGAPLSERGGLRPRWWWGAAAAAVLVVVVSRPWRPDESQRRADSAFTPASATRVPVGSTSEDASGATHFELALPTDARAVALVGDFNGWDEKATPMQREGGEWSAKVALPPGRHVYAFVVDGTRWLVDPLAPQVPDAGYGPANAVIVDPR